MSSVISCVFFLLKPWAICAHILGDLLQKHVLSLVSILPPVIRWVPERPPMFFLTGSKHKKVQMNAYLFWHGHTACTFSGKSPLSSHKTTLKQQINGSKRWKMRERERERESEREREREREREEKEFCFLSWFGWVFVTCSVKRWLFVFGSCFRTLAVILFQNFVLLIGQQELQSPSVWQFLLPLYTGQLRPLRQAFSQTWRDVMLTKKVKLNTQRSYLALEIRNTSTTTKTWVAYGNSHLVCV